MTSIVTAPSAPRRGHAAPPAQPRCRGGLPPSPMTRRSRVGMCRVGGAAEEPAPSSCGPVEASRHRPPRRAHPAVDLGAQHGDETAVDLHRRDMRPGVGQGQGERTQAGADLDHGCPRARRRPAGRCGAPCWRRRRSSGPGRGWAPARGGLDRSRTWWRGRHATNGAARTRAPVNRLRTGGSAPADGAPGTASSPQRAPTSITTRAGQAAPAGRTWPERQVD